MFVGHLGAGLALKAAEPRVNLGALFAAALFADVLLWGLVLAGAESVGTPAHSQDARFFTFTFPYSHGVAATIAWTALAAGIGWLAAGRGTPRRGRIAAALALGVASHVVLDVLVHVPDIPIAGSGSVAFGLGLWRAMPLALLLEVAIAATALAIALRAIPWPRWRRWLLAATVALAAVLTIAGPYAPGEPPPVAALALSSLAMLALLVAVGFWVEGQVSMIRR